MFKRRGEEIVEELEEFGCMYMGKDDCCIKCNAKIKDDEVFIHDEEKYCPECALEHAKGKHSSFYRTPM